MSLARLAQLLPLPESDLQQVLDYASTLSKAEAADHFNNLLGESPQSIEFISSFNSKRHDPSVATSSADTGVPKTARKHQKKKADIHTPAPRQIQDTYAAQGTAYKKKDEDDYITKKPVSGPSTSNAFSLSSKPAAVQAPRPPPSAAGSLISDSLAPPKPSSSASSRNNSRNASPAPKTKITITGGTSMHGNSTILNTLDAAIRTLEISTNPSLLDSKKRACNCIATRHALLASAPNCLNCGKVICVKEGLGPCTFCGTPLLSAVEVQSMISSLKSERGHEKMLLDNAGNKRAEIAAKPKPFTAPKDQYLTPAEQAAKAHRDKLLSFQSQNAKRTTVHDEAADFDVSVAVGGAGNLWASPADRARELKRQQKVLAEQEWNARPEYEKRRQVVSIDLVKGKVMKRMAAVDRPDFSSGPASEDEVEVEQEKVLAESSGNAGGGTFSRNPLLGGLIRPVWKGKDVAEGEEKPKKKLWRRVQDDLEDNEGIILDGGAFGGSVSSERVDNREEPACG